MTLVHFVRHAAHVAGDAFLLGRTVDVELSTNGRAQARRAAEALAQHPVDALQTSPRRRARETAAIIAEAIDHPVEVCADLDEVDVGAWSGRRFAELDADPAWRVWNTERSSACPPGGEPIAEVRARLFRHLAGLGARAPQGSAILVTHAELVRTAVLSAHGRSDDDFASIDIPLASITVLHWDGERLQPCKEG